MLSNLLYILCCKYFDEYFMLKNLLHIFFNEKEIWKVHILHSKY